MVWNCYSFIYVSLKFLFKFVYGQDASTLVPRGYAARPSRVLPIYCDLKKNKGLLPVYIQPGCYGSRGCAGVVLGGLGHFDDLYNATSHK